MTKNTQGEWEIEFSPTETEGVNVRFRIFNSHSLTICSGQSQEHLAKDYANYIGEDECRANARLLRAAPKLLEALQEVHSWIVCSAIASAEDMAQSHEHLEKVISAAIAAATGEEE